MKRSEINALLRESVGFLKRSNFNLPPFAFWSPSEWASKGHEIDEIRRNGLGWDITDFGSGEFRRVGLVLFTIRNGNPAETSGKSYCEKILIVDKQQVTPMHFHWDKMEDIINRTGGDLVVRLYNSTPEEKLADTPVVVSVDGQVRCIAAGQELRLKPGESITLAPRLYHEFWAEKEKTLLGEVSKVNDDRSDNKFLNPVGRFPTIEEDEPRTYLLCTEYPTASVSV